EQIDILVALRAAHENKGLWSGINVHTGQVSDMWKEGVLEPVKVKEHAIGSAVEVASMILRIDDVIAAAKPPPPPKGGPPPD
ncbi:thermosome subunit, partial [Candidatus Bathyarchaeota archaeon]